MNEFLMVQNLCKQQGIPFTSISTPKSFSIQEQRYQKWIELGYHGEMDYLVRHFSMKYNPQKILNDCQSIISVALPYYSKYYPIPNEQKLLSGKVSCYAWGRDYHKVLGNKLKNVVRDLQRLFPNDRFSFVVDSTPLDERWIAYQAGLGFLGYNTLLIIPPFGSFFFLGEILTTRVFPSAINHSFDFQYAEQFCQSCQKCLRACPTQALLGPYRKDSSRCISYLTIEHRGSIPESLRKNIGNWLLGCDICQLVCPYNQNLSPTLENDFLHHRLNPSQSLETIFLLQDERAFHLQYDGTCMIRPKWIGLVRNATIVAGNIQAKKFLPNLYKIASSSNSMLVEHANWAIQQMSIIP